MTKRGEPATVVLIFILALIFAGGVYLGYILQTSDNITGAIGTGPQLSTGLCIGEMFGVCTTTLILFIVVIAIIVLHTTKTKR